MALVQMHAWKPCQPAVVLGYDVGEADGKLGNATRAAVKKAQIKAGLPADSWPTAELMARLRGG